MVGPAVLTLALLAPSAPVPVGPPAPPPAADPAKAAEFGNLVYAAAMEVATQRRDVELPDLAAGAIRGMYEAAGKDAPADIVQAVRAAKRHEDRMQLIGEARLRLAGAAPLRGVRAYLAAVHGFRHAFDAFTGLAPLNPRSVAVDTDFGLGFELDGVEGLRATAYKLERRIAAGELPATGLLEQPPRPDLIPAPAAYPWRVKTVVPTSPAHKAGLRPGDVVTHLNDEPVTPATADRLFARLAYPPEAVPDPRTGITKAAKFEIRVRRGAAEHTLAMMTDHYSHTGVVGTVLRPDGSWEGMHDPLHRIGYLRVGAVETGCDLAAAAVVSELVERGCRALVLDLRWCPGGYVTDGANLAGLFLPADAVVARVEVFPKLAGTVGNEFPSVYRPSPILPRFTDLPLAVLVGSETLGGGELIAAAIQEPGRAVVAGQRTPGRAATMQLIDLRFGGLSLRATYGTTLRPSGKPRGRTPTSAPTDDWGIRPDPGLEVPVTPAIAAQVRAWAEEQALRPVGDRTALPFDDPDHDPVRAAALAHLRKRLGPPPPAAAQN
jgi:C-terminal processing protease CtpA/Prc